MSAPSVRNPAPSASICWRWRGAAHAALPAELDRVIDKCLEKDPELRYQHAADIRSDLKRLMRDTSSGKKRGHCCDSIQCGRHLKRYSRPVPTSCGAR